MRFSLIVSLSFYSTDTLSLSKSSLRHDVCLCVGFLFLSAYMLAYLFLLCTSVIDRLTKWVYAEQRAMNDVHSLSLSCPQVL